MFVNINLKMLIVLQLEFFLIIFCVMKYIAFYLMNGVGRWGLGYGQGSQPLT